MLYAIAMGQIKNRAHLRRENPGYAYVLSLGLGQVFIKQVSSLSVVCCYCSCFWHSADGYCWHFHETQMAQ